MITTQKIKELRILFKEHRKWSEIMSEHLKVAKDRNGENKLFVMRNDKKEEIKEKDLWDELYYGGFGSQAWGLLSAKYPEIAEAHKKDEEMAIKLRDFSIMNFGFNFSQMSMVDLIDLIMAIRRYELMRFFFIDKLISIFYGIFGKSKE